MANVLGRPVTVETMDDRLADLWVDLLRQHGLEPSVRGNFFAHTARAFTDTSSFTRMFLFGYLVMEHEPGAYRVMGRVEANLQLYVDRHLGFKPSVTVLRLDPRANTTENRAAIDAAWRLGGTDAARKVLDDAHKGIPMGAWFDGAGRPAR
jgi:hypothetical protein